MDDSYKPDIKAALRCILKRICCAFTDHPRQTGESFFQHLCFTVKMASRLFYSALVLTVHGMFPFLFTRTASTEIEAIYAMMRARIPQSRRAEIDSADMWHI